MGDEWDNGIEGVAALGDDLIVTSTSSVDPEGAPAGGGASILSVARLRE